MNILEPSGLRKFLGNFSVGEYAGQEILKPNEPMFFSVRSFYFEAVLDVLD
jgi:hypothetical protein